MPRPAAPPGIWRPGYEPRPPVEDRVPTRRLVLGAAASGLAGWTAWSLLKQGYLWGWWWQYPYIALTPWQPGSDPWISAAHAYEWAVGLTVAVIAARLGRWPETARRLWGWSRARRTPPKPQRAPVPPPHADPAAWPRLRSGGAVEAADRLAQDLRAGGMTDVDHARIAWAWREAEGHPDRVAAFVREVRRSGASAYLHASGARDLPGPRTAHHDLSLRQVRIGVGADDERTPRAYRGAGVALSPEVLSTSALVVGPPTVTARIIRPALESLSLLTLAGQAAVVSVGSAAAGPDEAYDVVLRPGRDAGPGLDLYGGTNDPDAAAATVAEALVGDLGDSRRAAAHLAQLLGPHRAAYGRFPTVRELRDLLDVEPGPLKALRHAVEGMDEHARDLAAHERQAAREASALMAERIALLDRPAFRGVFTPMGPADSRMFSLLALDEQPLRVRVELPEHGHADAARIIARLTLASFTEWAAARADQTRFACLLIDDAAQAVTPQTVRALQRLRAAHAGLLLGLPGLADVPEQLRAPLLGAAGVRVACAGITPWDAEVYAAAWGHEWVERRSVTAHEVRPDEPMARALQTTRQWMTGRPVTRESVTTTREQRERWSASDLADLPAGHAVVSMSTAAGERTPPILITT